MQQPDWDRLLDLLRHRDVYRTGQYGTVLYDTSGSLSLAAMPFAPRDGEFRAVLEFHTLPADPPGVDPVIVYWADEHPMHYTPATGILTVQRATFQAVASFVVIYTGLISTLLGESTFGPGESKPVTIIQHDWNKLKATVQVVGQVLSAVGQGGSWISPVDFVATRASATELTLSLPAALAGVTAVQFRSVIEWTAAGTVQVYTPEVHHFAWAAPKLTVTGATFGATSQFMVVIVSQQKAIERRDYPSGEHGLQVGGRAYAGIPPAVHEGDFMPWTGDLSGSGRTWLTRGLDRSNSNVETWEKPATDVAGQGVRDCIVANTAYQLTSENVPCIAVQLVNMGAGNAVWGDDDLTTSGGSIPKPGQGILWVLVANVSLLYVASDGAGDDIEWTALKRE